MRKIHRLICALCLLFFAITITDTTQAEPNDTLPYETLAKQSPSLQGYFYPRTGEYGESPGYEIVLENNGEETAQNIILSVSTSSHGVDETIQPPHWECTNPDRTNCSLSIGELRASENITRTFLFSYMTPAIHAAQSCITSYRQEFEEPVVTVTADDMEPLNLTGTGENIIIDFPGPTICPALGRGWSGNIYPKDSDASDDGPFIYIIEVQSEYGSTGTIYFNDESYEIDQEQSDERWVFDESDWIENVTNRWRLDLEGPPGIFTVSLALNPIVPTVVVATEEDAYIELVEPDIVLDGPVFGVQPIPLTKSGETVTCRCYVVTDGSTPVSPTPTPIPTPIIPAVTAGDYRVESGGDIAVKIEGTDLEDVAAIAVDVGYDPAILQVVSCSNNLADGFGFGACNPHYLPDSVRFNVIATQGMNGDANLAEIVFEAVGQIGDVSPIRLQVIEMADLEGQPVTAEATTGQVSISNQLIGDVNGDGVIDSADNADISSLNLRRVYLPYIGRE